MNFQITSLLKIINSEIENKNSNTTSKEDFLFALLKNIDDKNLIKELIEKSNLSKDEKEKIKLKFNIDKDSFNIDKNSQNNENLLKIDIVKSALPNFNEKIITDKLNDKDINIDNKKTDNITIESILKNMLQTENTQEKIISNFKEIDNKTLKKIKTLIIKNSNDNPILKKIVTLKEFKNAKSFKDLIDLSKKYNLNLNKFIISKIPQKETNKEFANFNLSTQIVKTKIDKNKINKKNISLIHSDKIKTLNDLLNPKKEITQKESENIINENFLKKSKKEIKKDIDNTQTSSFNHLEIKDLKHKIIEAKQSIKHFTNSLKEAVENYKPPITKLSLELHPKELGKVEVTLKQRGDNLHVQINTNNQNAINFFTTQQQELKNSLVNMGFTNIDMNFNSNQDQKKEHQQNKKQKNNYQNSEEELVIDMNYKYA